MLGGRQNLPILVDIVIQNGSHDPCCVVSFCCDASNKLTNRKWKGLPFWTTWTQGISDQNPEHFRLYFCPTELVQGNMGVFSDSLCTKPAWNQSESRFHGTSQTQEDCALLWLMPPKTIEFVLRHFSSVQSEINEVGESFAANLQVRLHEFRLISACLLFFYQILIGLFWKVREFTQRIEWQSRKPHTHVDISSMFESEFFPKHPENPVSKQRDQTFKVHKMFVTHSSSWQFWLLSRHFICVWSLSWMFSGLDR